jgi:RNA polymerase sigma factor (sigma-70 family)
MNAAWTGRAGEKEGLSAREEQVLGWALVERGCPAARERMLRAHRTLVESIAKRYAGRGLSEETLVERGLCGLRRAVDEFDPSLGARFSTHASWWIKHAIRRALQASVGSLGPGPAPARAASAARLVNRGDGVAVQDPEGWPARRRRAEAV